MLVPGVYYFWLKNRDARGEYAVMITQQLLVKLNRQACPRRNIAFRACINKISKGTRIPSCQIAPRLPKPPETVPEIERQLKKLARDVKQAAPLNIFISDLLPMEQAGHWSKRLQILLEKYAKIEASRNETALVRQSYWLKTYLSKNKMTFEPAELRWGRVQGTGLQWIPLFIHRDLTAGEDWIFQSLGIQKGATRWQWRVPLSILVRHHANLCSLLPGISNFEAAIPPQLTTFAWGQKA